MNGSQESQKSESAPSVNQFTGIKRNENSIPYGYCHCGCGKKTTISQVNNKRRGYVRGNPNKFFTGHKNRRISHLTSDGYSLIRQPQHPNCHVRGNLLEHILIVEKSLGHILPPDSVVHHINGIKNDNRNCNLVVCENRAYHNRLHLREKSLLACGHADWRKCNFCKQYDDPENLYISPRGDNVWHNNCVRKYQRLRRSCFETHNLDSM